MASCLSHPHWSAVNSGKKCGYRLAIRDTTPQPALMEGEGEDEDEEEEKPPVSSSLRDPLRGQSR